MKRKIITALSLLFVFTFLFSAQINHVSAQLADMPITGPVTIPITGPITSPITSPVSLFRISGNVSYHLLGIFKHSIARLVPAVGVTVTAKDWFNGHTASTTTDNNGNYVIDPGQAGHYRVTVSGGETNFYTPPFGIANLNNNHPKDTHVNFQGLIFKF